MGRKRIVRKRRGARRKKEDRKDGDWRDEGGKNENGKEPAGCFIMVLSFSVNVRERDPAHRNCCGNLPEISIFQSIYVINIHL